MTRRALLGFSLVIALGCRVAQASDLAGDVWEMIEAQDRAVDGGEIQHKKIAARVEETISSLSAEDWKQPRNYRAAVIYVLAGGSPTRLRRLLRDHVIEEATPPLLTASLAFADGDREAATKLFSPIDVRAFPPILAGHLALIRGSLLIGVDNTEADKSLSFARLIMPGSQVEEAALRRELAIVDPKTEFDRYILLARRYQFRYPSSPFAEKYWQSLTITASKVGLAFGPDALASTEELFKAAPAKFGFEFHAALARASILLSRADVLRSQTQAAAAFAEKAQATERLELYQAAADAMNGDLAASDSSIKNINASKLNREEVKILNAIRGVGVRLGDAGEQQQTLPAADGPSAETPLVQRLQQTLEDSRKLLHRAGGQ
ncbi:MAG TPA: hypothetical protein VIF34_12595 [Methylocystis sp.]